MSSYSSPETGDFDSYFSTTTDFLNTCANYGRLYVYGANNLGQLGDNSIANRSSPVQTVTGGINWVQVYAGYVHSAGIKTDGTLWNWGWNDWGQLGDNTVIKKSSPLQVGTAVNWKQVACGSYHTAAVKTNGELWTWGYNAYGQLGDNTTVHKSSPVQTIAGGTNWKQVSCGDLNHIAAIKTDGTLWVWGSNGGQIGDNTTTNRSSPVQTICQGTNWKYVATGGATTIAIKTDGTLWGWGNAGYSRLADASAVSTLSPVQIGVNTNNWKQVSLGLYNVAAIREFDDF